MDKTGKQDILKILYSSDVKLILKPILGLVVVVVLYLFGLPFGISRLRAQFESLAKERKNLNILEQKLSVLSSFQSDSQTSSENLSLLLPDRSPSVLAVSQFKYLAGKNGVNIEDLRVGAESDSGGDLSSISLNISVTGDFSQTLGFIKDLEKMAPLSKIVSLTVTSSEKGARTTDIRIDTYYAPLPSKLPSLTEPITDFTAKEKEVLTKVAGFYYPSLTETVAQPAGTRTDPFSQ